VDGKIHYARKEYDEIRTRILEERGFKIIRFTNEEIMSDSYCVFQKIKLLL
jgi:leucyl-tRNA synthetase